MTLEEFKADIIATVEKAWNTLFGTDNVDKAREVVSQTTAELAAHAQAVGQHLFDHVLGNAEAPTEPSVVPGPVVEQPATEAPAAPAVEAAPVEAAPESGPVA